MLEVGQWVEWPVVRFPAELAATFPIEKGLRLFLTRSFSSVWLNCCCTSFSFRIGDPPPSDSGGSPSVFAAAFAMHRLWRPLPSRPIWVAPAAFPGLGGDGFRWTGGLRSGTLGHLSGLGAVRQVVRLCSSLSTICRKSGLTNNRPSVRQVSCFWVSLVPPCRTQPPTHMPFLG